MIMTRAEARTYYEYYSKLVDKLMAAKLALVSSGAKSYIVDDVTLTRFDIDKLSADLDDAIKKKAMYEALMNGRKARKAVGVIPRDI